MPTAPAQVREASPEASPSSSPKEVEKKEKPASSAARPKLKSQKSVVIEPQVVEKVSLRFENSYGIGVTWDHQLGFDAFGKHTDLDMQAVIVDNHGAIVDAVYYNQLQAMSGAIGHSDHPDHHTKQNHQEIIWITLNKMPQAVMLVVFVLAAYNHGDLKSAGKIKIQLFENKAKIMLREFELGAAKADVEVIGMMKRKQEGSHFWYFEELEPMAEQGSHFLDILEPTIGGLIRQHIPQAPEHQKISFDMEHGHMVDIPASSLKRLIVGMGGKLAKTVKVPVALDIAVVFFTEEGHLTGVVDGKSQQQFGVMHSSCEATLETKQLADDEALTIDLLQVPEKATQICLVLTATTGNFQMVQNAYVRVVDQMCHELLRFDVQTGHKENGLVIGRLHKKSAHHKKRWVFTATGKFFDTEDGAWRRPEEKASRHFLFSLVNGKTPKKKTETKNGTQAKAERLRLSIKEMSKDKVPASGSPATTYSANATSMAKVKAKAKGAANGAPKSAASKTTSQVDDPKEAPAAAKAIDAESPRRTSSLLLMPVEEELGEIVEPHPSSPIVDHSALAITGEPIVQDLAERKESAELGPVPVRNSGARMNGLEKVNDYDVEVNPLKEGVNDTTSCPVTGYFCCMTKPS